MLADPSCHHVAQKAGERVFLPGHVGVGDALHHVFADVIGDTGLLERFAPDRVPQTRSQRYHQFESAGDAQYDAGLAAVVFTFRSVTGIFQRLAGRDQSQQLGGVDRFKHVGGDVELHRVEVNRRDETATLTIGAVGALLVLVVIIFHPPVGCRDIGDGINPVRDVRPVGLLVVSLRKETADADNGQWYGTVGWCRFLIVRFHLKVLLDFCKFERFHAQGLWRDRYPLAAEKVGAGQHRCAKKNI